MAEILEWRSMGSAPRDREILLLLGETIPDHADCIVGSWISTKDAVDIGETHCGWMCWNSGDDWELYT